MEELKKTKKKTKLEINLTLASALSHKGELGKTKRCKTDAKTGLVAVTKSANK